MPQRVLSRNIAWAVEYADYLLAHINAEFGCRTTFTFDEDAARSHACGPVP